MMRVQDSSTNGTMAGTQLVRNGVVDVPRGVPIQVGEYTFSIHVRGAERYMSPPPQAPRDPSPGQIRETDRAPAAKMDVQAPAPAAPPQVVPPPAGTPTNEVRAVAPEPEKPPNGARRQAGHGHTGAREAVKARAASRATATPRALLYGSASFLQASDLEWSPRDDPSLRPKVLNAFVAS
jgi:hypothetical protein